MIAIALSCEPKVLLADEPTTALDVTIQAQILRVLDDLRDRLGMATLLVTHDMGVVAGRTTRINVMYAGRIVESAETHRLFTGMRHPYTQALLGSIPRLEQDADQAARVDPGAPARPRRTRRGMPLRAALRAGHRPVPRQEPPLQGEDASHVFACWHPVDGPISLSSQMRVVAERAARLDVRALKPLLQIEHVVREYPVTAGLLKRKVASVKAVSDVTLTVGEGEALGLVGESGAARRRSASSSSGSRSPTAAGRARGEEVFAQPRTGAAARSP